MRGALSTEPHPASLSLRSACGTSSSLSVEVMPLRHPSFVLSFCRFNLPPLPPPPARSCLPPPPPPPITFATCTPRRCSVRLAHTEYTHVVERQRCCTPNCKARVGILQAPHARAPAPCCDLLLRRWCRCQPCHSHGWTTGGSSGDDAVAVAGGAVAAACCCC
jgi:hypothetical protein